MSNTFLKPNPYEEKMRVITLKHLQSRMIVNARYMTEDERKALGWSRRCMILILDDGTFIYPSCDNEGNDAGALFTSIDTVPLIGTI